MADAGETTQKFSAGAWPLALTVTIGLFVFKFVPNSPLSEISYWLVFSPVLLLVGLGVAASLLLGLVGVWGVRRAEKTLGRLVDAMEGSTDDLLEHLSTLEDDEFAALVEVVSGAYVERIVKSELAVLNQNEVA